MAQEVEERKWEEGGEEEEGEPSPFVEQISLQEQPPVLPVNSSFTEQPGATTTATSGATATGTAHAQKREGQRPPEPGASELWGLSEEIDKWQVSSMPEERQYFAMDVSSAMVVRLQAKLATTYISQ